MQEENLTQPETNRAEENVYTPEIRNPEPEKDKKESGFFVFNLNTLLSLILLGGLIILYVLHFNTVTEEVDISLPLQQSGGKSLSVVYVNTDSLNIHYDLVNALRNDLEATAKKLQNELLNEQTALEKEANDFQQKISANAIPEEKAKVMYEQLMQKQQLLMQKKERYTQQIAEQEATMNIRLVDSVTSFLRRFNKQYKFDYIMGYKYGGEILVPNDTLDITPSVLKALNEEYLSRKK